MFENMMLWKIFGLKMVVMGGWIRVHNKDHHEVLSSPNNTWWIKPKRIRLVGMWHIWGR
jgi:hypothetical protein